jgi:hypothetical protein
LVIENFYQQLGGRITVMLQEGAAHHPHSLRDPTPIADFIVQSWQAVSNPPPAFVGPLPSRSAYYSTKNSYRYFAPENNYITCRGPFFTDCYDRYNFSVQGAGNVTVITPKAPAPGMPMVFRTDFVERTA